MASNRVAVRRPNALGPGELSMLAGLAKRESGLSITADRADFLVARLSGQLTRLGLADFAAYAAHLSRPEAEEDRRRFVEALTTHTTSFFREGGQYEWLADHGIAALESAGIGRHRPIELWSAACSSGQELYSAMMTVLSAPGRPQSRQVRGTGTDLSTAILRRCEQGIYCGEEIEGIPLALRRRFLLSARTDADRYRIAPEIRQITRWRQANLTRAETLFGITADIAFLRNVLIYFDPSTREQVLRNVTARLNPGGFLLTGHSESIEAARYGLSQLRPSIYRKGGA